MQKRTAPDILTVPVGPLQENCYIVYPKDRGTLYIIDPGSDPLVIMKHIAQFEPRKYQILLTHAHVDHISAVGALCDALALEKIFLHPKDLELYKSPVNQLPPVMSVAENLPDTEWNPVLFADDFTVLETPGHTFGSVCYYFPALKAVISGDTLFAGSVGRTDLPGSGKHEDMVQAVREKLFTLPGDTKVFPGHGPDTTIENEKNNNPFFKD